MNPIERRPILRFHEGNFVPAVDEFAEEMHVTLTSEAGHRVSVLASPHDLDAFAVGHALTEGWWDGFGDIPSVVHGSDESGQTVHLVHGTGWKPVKEARFILPSCGGCGEQLSAPPPGHRFTGGTLVAPMHITERMRSMKEQQDMFRATGGVHAAALFASDGDLLLREDIGRHTALDKAVGAWLLAGRDDPPATLLLSGRCGWDLMAKVVRIGLKQVACVGAMSNQAAILARDHGIVVMGFATKPDPQFVGPWPDVATKA